MAIALLTIWFPRGGRIEGLDGRIEGFVVISNKDGRNNKVIPTSWRRN